MVGDTQLTRPDQQWLRVSILHTRPVELTDLSRSLGSLSALHNRYATRLGLAIGGDLVRLYVREIRTGSIIVDLIAQAQNFALFAETVQPIVEFGKTLVETLLFFQGKASPPDGLKKPDAENVNGFLDPVARDVGATINVQAHEGSVQQFFFSANSTDANAIQNRANRWIEEQKEPIRGIQTNCLLRFYQARNDTGSQIGNASIIERISLRPVKTIIEGEEVRARILGDALFQKAYIATVRVETIDDVPKLYTILEIIDSIDLG